MKRFSGTAKVTGSIDVSVMADTREEAAQKIAINVDNCSMPVRVDSVEFVEIETLDGGVEEEE